MGYYTRYHIDTDTTKRTPLLLEQRKDRIVSEISKTKMSEDLKEELVSLVYGKYELPDVGEINYWDHLGFDPFDDTTKWYSHEDDMRAISKEYPGVVFILSGEGEESGDIWRKYFCEGKMQTAPAKVTFEDFDPEKLV